MPAVDLMKLPILNNDKLHLEFLQWWYSPWKQRHIKHCFEENFDAVAMRDRYLVWCAEKNIPPGLPSEYDTSWCKLYTLSKESFLDSLKLFSGIISAHYGNIISNTDLSHEDKKWCISISATQPVKDTLPQSKLHDGRHCYLLQGITEIKMHLDLGFPGLWPRLKLIFSDDYLEEYGLGRGGLRDFSRGLGDVSIFSYQRALRCWKMCQQRTESR